MPKVHYHLMAGSGRIVKHSHRQPGHRHEHDRMYRYAVSRRIIEREQHAYRDSRREYLKSITTALRTGVPDTSLLGRNYD